MLNLANETIDTSPYSGDCEIYYALRYLYEKGDDVSAGYDICPDNYNPFEQAKEHK